MKVQSTLKATTKYGESLDPSQCWICIYSWKPMATCTLLFPSQWEMKHEKDPGNKKPLLMLANWTIKCSDVTEYYLNNFRFWMWMVISNQDTEVKILHVKQAHKYYQSSQQPRISNSCRINVSIFSKTRTEVLSKMATAKNNNLCKNKSAYFQLHMLMLNH
jgi:hypothetical protein